MSLFSSHTPSTNTLSLLLVMTSLLFQLTRAAVHINTLGSPSDKFTQNIVDQCLKNATLFQEYGRVPGFERDHCPNLVDCVLSNLREVDKAGMAAAISIVALIPTVLALIGAEPLELVHLAFVSPIRALCTCLFGVGLPSNLFARLQRYSQSGGSSTVVYVDDTDRRGPVQLLFPLSPALRRRRTAFENFAFEILIIGLAAIMLWRNWRINSMVMVTWRCEYRLLLLFWPISCIGWAVLTVGSLLIIARKIEIVRQSDGRPSRKSWWTAFVAGFWVRGQRQERTVEEMTAKPMQKPEDSVAFSLPACNDGGGDSDDERLALRIQMPSELHWRWWNTAIQTLAVGIYLYATFVLASMMFLTGNEAIVYTTVMVICLSAIRIISSFL
ncbi:MAG: hypothetical protein M1816_000861 [Peltula sp. TS41687]|nr:MAG: hypothetical protein M1816_000861 [Peltula sp. TS41687]